MSDLVKIPRFDATLVTDACGNKDVLMRERFDGLFVRYEDVEQRIVQQDAQLERLTDLVRCQRNELYDDGLIDEREFAALCADSENGQRVARLEGYDKTVSGVEATVETLKGLLREYRYGHDVDGEYRFHDECRTHATSDKRCSLCKRTDQQLQPKGEQG